MGKLRRSISKERRRILKQNSEKFKVTIKRIRADGTVSVPGAH